MKPEDIDNLFKERLGSSSPTPPGDLWNRLQSRMEAEMPEKAPVPLQPKEEKSSFMWIYSSVAATISLLLTVGVVFYNIETGTPEVNDAITDKGRIALQETPAVSKPAPEMMAQTEAAQHTGEEEKNIIPQATDATPVASNMAEEVVKSAPVAKATPKAVQRKSAKATATVTQPQATVQQAVAASTPTVNAAEVAEAVATLPAEKPVAPAAVAKADVNLNAEPVEIIFKRSVSSDPQLAQAEEAEAPSNLDKKAKLAKNIFKQVRNLASGDAVELSELGINADKVALNTQIGKQKFSKVIHL